MGVDGIRLTFVCGCSGLPAAGPENQEGKAGGEHHGNCDAHREYRGHLPRLFRRLLPALHSLLEPSNHRRGLGTNLMVTNKYAGRARESAAGPPFSCSQMVECC